MNISDLLAPEAVLASLKAQTKKQLLQELASFHKRRLLEAMKSALPGTLVKELRFRAK